MESLVSSIRQRNVVLFVGAGVSMNLGLLSWKGLGCDLPSSQALLFWIREAMPEQFQAVLSRVKAHQLGETA